MGTEDWILKSTKLITNTKKKIKNLDQRLDSQKYSIKKTKQNCKNYKIYIYEICLKNRIFFNKVILGYKMNIKGVIKNLKIKNLKMIIVKYIQEFLWSC